MSNLFLRNLFVCLITGCGVIRAYGTPATQFPRIVTGVETGEIILDGKLDETAWQTAPVVELVQQSPKPGSSTRYRTTVRILRGKRHIYFGIVSDDPDPSRIAVHTLQRDGDQSNDDNVIIVLDTFGQKKLAYVFQVNAGGAMADGLISPGYTNPNGAGSSPVDYSWNGYWEAAVQRTPGGWIAEIAINTQSLQFDKQALAWGLNISRYVPREQLTLAWSGINLNASPTNLQWEGTLTGIQGLNQGSGFEFDPYALAQYDDVKHGTANKAGFDLKYNFTPQLAGLFTYHTDFAEAEANTLQANLSRFPSFIPETRAFFLDGSNIFTFSHNLGTNFIPFYSRSVGLVNGEVVPLDEGAKLLGHTGPWTLGVMDTQMAGTDVSNSSNLFAGRIGYNINNQWSIGTLATHGDPLGRSDNTLSAFDSIWSTSSLGGDKNLNVSAWGAHSSGSIPAGNPDGYGFDLEYPNDLWYADFNYNLFGDALDPALGFLPRPGTKQYNINVTYQPRPSAASPFSWIRQYFLNGSYYFVTGLNNRVQSEDWSFNPVQWVSQSGWSVGSGTLPKKEVVTSPFAIVPGVTIPTGTYNFATTYLGVSSPKSDPVSFSATGEAGGQYSGRSKTFISDLSFAGPAGQFTADLSSTLTWLYTPQGNGMLRVLGLNLGYSFTPNLTLSTLTQYNNVTHNVSANTRLQWIMKPGRYLYLVWNHGLALNPNLLQGAQTVTGNQLTLKLVWGLY